MGQRLKDKVAFITGGGRGIGKEIAKAYVREGAAVVLASRNKENLEATAKELEEMGGKALAIPTDIRFEEQIIKAIEETVKVFGKIDILVNNSGSGGPNKPVVEMTLEEWNDTLACDVTGSMLCCREALKYMIPARSGNIIMIGSEGGRAGFGLSGYPNRSPYCCAKMALTGLMETLAQEVGQSNIRVNQISPGPVKGPRTVWVWNNIAKNTGRSVEEVAQDQVKNLSLKRIPEEYEIASVAVFLASDESSAITGQTIPVSGGLHIGI